MKTKMQEMTTSIQENVPLKIKGKMHHEYPSVKAFVIVNSSTERANILRKYQHFWRWSPKRIFCCCTWSIDKEMPKSYKLKGQYPIEVSPADIPSNILWENLEKSNFELNLRKSIYYFVILLIMILSTSVVVSATYYNRSIEQQSKDVYQDGKDAQFTCDNTILNQFNQDPQAVKNTNYLIDCYCRQLAEDFGVSSITDFWNFLQEKPICRAYSIERVTFFALIMLSSLSIVISNLFLQISIDYMSKFLRLKDVTSRYSVKTFQIFYSYFINTGIILLVLEASFQVDFFGLTEPMEGGLPSLIKLFFTNARFSGTYYDYNAEWYRNVGIKIMITMITYALLPLSKIFMYPLIAAFKHWRAKKQTLQCDMNQMIMNKQLDVTINYAMVLTQIFVTCLFFAGMPLLLPILFVGMLTTYLVEKYMILNFYTRCPQIDEKIDRKIFDVIKWAVILHLLNAQWVYGSPGFFPKNNEYTLDEFHFVIDDHYVFLSRISKAWLYFILVFLVIGSLIVKNTIGITFTKLLKASSGAINMVNNYKFEKVASILSTGGLSSYDIKKNPEYAPLIDAIDTANKFNTSKDVADTL